MSANPDMESILSQKMEQFRLDPDPADWEAIEERLHPKKRRRFFWWIFPLAGAMLIGGYFYSTEQQGSKVKDQPDNNLIAQPDNNSRDQQPSNATDQPDNNLTAQPDDKVARQQLTKEKGIASETTVPADQQQSIDQIKPAANKVVQEIKSSTPALEMPDKTQQSWNVASVDMDRWRPSMDIPSSISYTSAQQMTASVQVPLDSVTQPKKIPIKTTHSDKGWYLGAYAGIGQTRPFEPMSSNKAMDRNANSGTGGFSAFSQSTLNWNPGHHVNLGLLLQKKNKKTEWSMGLGLQSNGWSQTYTIYKDSILQNGTLFNRTTVANPTVKYKQLALEIPLLIGFKLAGKQNNSWWIHTGLNNAWVMQLSESSNTNPQASAPLPGASASIADSLLQTNKRSYLAQWQLGITYNHNGAKQHWQLRPYMQYGINAVTSSGEPNVNLFQWGLQWRYYFKKLK